MPALSDPAAILDAMDAYVYAKDRDGNYVYANKPVQELFGHSLDEIVGKDDSAFFDLAKSDDLKRNDEEVMATGETVRAREVDFIKETGEERTYLTVKKPVISDDGTVIGLYGLSMDITED